MTPPNLIGAQISFPIFSSGVTTPKSARRKSTMIQLNALADTEDALKIQHSQLRYDLISALKVTISRKEY